MCKFLDRKARDLEEASRRLERVWPAPLLLLLPILFVAVLAYFL